MSKPTMPLPVVARVVRAVPAGVVIVALLVAACDSPTANRSASATAGSSSTPSLSPSASAGPTVGAIYHETGASVLVLRIEQGGGFVPMDFLATQAPGFSLYGNGVVVFQPKVNVVPEPDASGVAKGVPWRTATLDEDQIQELLEFALGPGGLGAARDSYIEGGIADAPNTIFTIHAGGLDKAVLVSALSEEPLPGADAQIRRSFWKLASRLQDFDQGGTIATDAYSPQRFRGVLIEREAQIGVEPRGWPWPTIPLGEFKEGPQDGSAPTTFPHRTLTRDEVAVLKLDGIDGGAQGIAVKGGDGKVYGLVLRPLLADEPA